MIRYFDDEVIKCDAVVDFDYSWLCLGKDLFVGIFCIVDGD